MVKNIAASAACSEEVALAAIMAAGIKVLSISAQNNQEHVDYNQRRIDKKIHWRYMSWFPKNELSANGPVPSEKSWRWALGIEVKPVIPSHVEYDPARLNWRR